MSYYYCVAIGIKKGIYLNWDDCKKQVYKFSGCKYKKFDRLEDAEKYMELWCDESDYYIQEQQLKTITTFFKKNNNI